MRSCIARRLPGFFATALLVVVSPLFAAQTTADRIVQAINPSSTVQLRGSVNPHASARYDVGQLDPSTPITGIHMFFAPSASQQAELDALVKAQQTPGSPEYHQWVTPAEYGSLFGLSANDLVKVESWLQSEGFNVASIAPSRNSITFSGTAGQVEDAFQTEMHQYVIHGEHHYANATNLAIPSALSGIVLGVRNLSDFRPRPQVRFHPAAASATANFTSAQTGEHFMTPGDVATIYDVTPAYNSGYNGSGEKIAVVGQSSIVASDIEAFESAAGLTVKAPNMILVPSSGTATAVQGDEAESDLDVEYSGGMAPGATIDFVYVGNNSNYSVFDSLQYAVQNDLAPVISISYGSCETQLSSSDFASLDAVIQEGASQGQSIVASSGDTGSSGCWGIKGLSPTQQKALAVQYPASSAYATAIGGTEFPAADVATTNSTYWKSASGSDVVSSALSYIPEETWNDDSIAAGVEYGAADALSSSGGGTSTFSARPSWQTGVAGIASGSKRLVPDISLDASNTDAPYLFCTSDTSAWNQGQKASCNSGFRDSATQDLTAAGGTSFAAPIFAGMLTILNQKLGSSGQGVAASTLYTLASNSATYASAFHDITSSGNYCNIGSSYCSGAAVTDYAATAGYDEATGLGSIDFNNLLTAWAGTTGGSGSGGSTAAGSFTLAATPVTVAAGSSGTSTVTITSANGYAGTVGFTVTGSGTSLVADGCYAISNTAAKADSTATATLTIYTAKSSCSGSGVQSFVRKGSTTAASTKGEAPLGRTIPLGGAALAGVLLLGVRRSRKGWTVLGCLALVGALSFASGCGSNSSSAVTNSSTTATSTDVAAGSYALTVTGTDTTSSSITASTTVALTVQ